MLKIAIEGIDGSGKDTLIRYINNNLPNDYKIYMYNQCTDSLLGRHIRKKLKEDNSDDLLLSTAFMCEMITTSKIVNELKNENNSICIFNRWIYSTLSYGCDNEEEIKYFNNLKNYIIIPDIIIYLDIPIELAIERICKRTFKDFEKYEHSDVLAKVKDKYENVFSQKLCHNSNTNFIRVDSSRNNYKGYALQYILNRLKG